MVEYLISHKALPTILPTNLASLQSSEDMPRHLVPQENYCHKCPGNVPLSEPIAISKKAKIVTVTGIVEALSSHTYDFSCVNCGDHPPVVIIDLHKKGVFSMSKYMKGQGRKRANLTEQAEVDITEDRLTNEI
ncbi:hypothetical protein F7725_000093 [Dissostichus mawsoni]|uniref:Uncharacterized protein n=1 Tax=Dissostichus mawsoni TaxID=36200 RepID=A0A7J5ZHF7_DISMA|nr:hypothetical protein F7725_000093 [Dissostichus mawsoni]